MTKEFKQVENDGKKRGMRISLVFHTIILLLAFIWGCPYEPDKAQERQYAVAVNIENIDFIPAPSSNSNKAKEKEGATRKLADPVAPIAKKTEQIEVKTPEVKPPTPTPPKPTPPTPTPPVQTKTTSYEETEVSVAEPEVEVKEVEIDIPSPDVMDVPAPKPVEVVKTPRTKVNDGKANTSKNTTQSDSAPNSTVEGSGTGKGKQGTGKGADPSGNDGDSGKGTGGTGLGEYDDSGNGIFGRKVIHRNIAPILASAVSKSGKIYFKVCINQRGLVNYAELNELQTTITDRSILKSAIDAIYGYKFEPDPRAADEECGKIVINIDNFNGIR